MENDFVLQIRSTVFRLYDALWHLPSACRELVLQDGTDARRRLRKGRRVYLWEASGQELVGYGTVLSERQVRPMPKWQHEFSQSLQGPEPTAQRAVVAIDVRLDPPITRARIHQDRVLARATFFRNPKNVQGTVFNVRPEASAALDSLIDAERRRAGMFADEVPPDYLTAVSEADREGIFDPNDEEDARRRQLRAIAIRQGQPRFRHKLLRAYEHRCAITNCDATDALEAAHILPYTNERRNHISNGLLLRADVHTLFDLGLVAVDEDLNILVAPGLRASQYGLELSGRTLRVPTDPSCWPNREALKMHLGRSKCGPSVSPHV